MERIFHKILKANIKKMGKVIWNEYLKYLSSKYKNKLYSFKKKK